MPLAYTGSLPVGERRQPNAVAICLVDIPACSILTAWFRKLSGGGGIAKKLLCQLKIFWDVFLDSTFLALDY